MHSHAGAWERGSQICHRMKMRPQGPTSRGRELSQESDKWKHGAFTYALIEGIKGKADLIKNNKISMKELDAYVSATVPKITNGAQHPITNTPDGYVNFPVVIVK